MRRTITDWQSFCDHWAGATNFLIARHLLPCAFDFPPIDRIVAEMRTDGQAKIGSGARGDRLLRDTGDAAWRELPIADALRRPFSLAHFKLSVFDHPGGFLHGFREAVLDPWQAKLAELGFTWDRCYPIVFISGPGCATNYHMDFSHVLAWQIVGTKRFCGLREPDRWAPREVRLGYQPHEFVRPAALTDDDTLAYDMPPGTVLWNALLTPHWVEAGDEVAMSVNISHGGLRLAGQLCPHEAELEAWRQASPEKAPAPFKATY